MDCQEYKSIAKYQGFSLYMTELWFMVIVCCLVKISDVKNMIVVHLNNDEKHGVGSYNTEWNCTFCANGEYKTSNCLF